MGDAIRVLVVDDHKVVRNGIRTFLSVFPDVEVVGEARNGAESLAAVAELAPHVVLMDLKMPVMDGPDAIAELRKRHPEVHVVALTSMDDESLVLRSLDAGAVGFLYKDADENELMTAIRMAAEGRGVIAPDAMTALVAQREASAQTPQLTPRELEILKLVAGGYTNPQIGERLYISVSTVNFHLHNILDKLDAKTRTEAVSTAVRDGLIDL